MDEKRALDIVKTLADGTDPTTGEVFPADSPYQNADIMRALHKAAEALEVSERKRSLPARAGKPWDKSESVSLIEQFDKGIEIVELAKIHQRTRGAIRSQLKKL
ncbi:MAG: hypothetical protein WAV28_12010 [Sedimentisphaerales bacterium]